MQATFRPMATNEDVLWARHGQQIVARVISSLKGKRRSFKGYHDQLGADDVIPEEARNHSEKACFGKVVWEGRQVIIAGPNKQARLKAGKRALGLLQTHSTDGDLAAFLHLSSSQCQLSQCLGQPVPVPGAARACLGEPAFAWGSQCLLRDNKKGLIRL